MSQQESRASKPLFLSMPASELLSAFGGGEAAPGSGSAAALMGLLSAQLILTVCSISKIKEGTDALYHSFDKIADDISYDIEPRLSRLLQKDAELFDHAINLRRLRDESKAREEEIEKQIEKSEEKEELENTLKEETEKRLDFARRANEHLDRANNCVIAITELCLRLIDHGNSIFEKGWAYVRGDSAAAISVALSGVTSAICIMGLNLKTLRKAKYPLENLAKYNELHAAMVKKQDAALRAIAVTHKEAMEG
jgi:formiminotetrahydrofolate cyclodeaminase